MDDNERIDDLTLETIFNHDPFAAETQEPENNPLRVEQSQDDPESQGGQVVKLPSAQEPPAQAPTQEPPSRPAAQATTPPDQRPSPEQATGQPAEVQQQSESEDLRRRITMLEQANQNLSRLLQQHQQAPQPAPQQRGQQQRVPEQQDDIPDYMYSIPPQYVDGLRSEDPNVVGSTLQTLVSSIGRAVHKQVLERVDGMFKERVPDVNTAVRGILDQREQAQRVDQDYYGNFPHHNRPELRPLVAAIAQQVYQQYPGINDWTPDLRNEIGRQVDLRLQSFGALAGGPVQQQTQQQLPTQQQPRQRTVVPRSRVPRMVGQGARPPAAPSGSTQQGHIDQLLFG